MSNIVVVRQSVYSSHDITFVIFSDQRDQSIIMHIANNTLPVSYTLLEFMHSKYITYVMHYAHSSQYHRTRSHDIKYISAPRDGLVILYILPQTLTPIQVYRNVLRVQTVPPTSMKCKSIPRPKSANFSPVNVAAFTVGKGWIFHLLGHSNSLFPCKFKPTY